jgi:hypothetical protein
VVGESARQPLAPFAKDEPFFAELARLFASDLVQDIRAALEGVDDATKALAGAIKAFVDDENFEFEVLDNRVDENGISRFRARVTYTNRKQKNGTRKSLADFARLADPRNWSENVPQTFRAAYPMDLPQGAVPMFADPKEKIFGEDRLLQVQQAGWHGHLFENAGIPLDGLPDGPSLTRFRNVLNIEYSIDGQRPPPQPQITLGYSLYQTLSSAVGFLHHGGGIGVDSGSGSVTLDGDRVTFEAGKNVRFSEQAPFSPWLNAWSLPFLRFWISTLILSGISADAVRLRSGKDHNDDDKYPKPGSPNPEPPKAAAAGE